LAWIKGSKSVKTRYMKDESNREVAAAMSVQEVVVVVAAAN
jgi:hypothetical protein